MSKLGINVVPVIAAALASVAVSAAQAEIIYNNSTTPVTVGGVNQVFGPGNLEVGNEILLGGTERNLTKFSFQYSTVADYSGGVSATLRFYQNNGAPVNGYNSPGASPFFTETFAFGAGDVAPTGKTMEFLAGVGLDFPATGLSLPSSDITWTLQFSGNGANLISLDLFNPPTVGANFADYWQNSGGGWQLMTNSVPMGIGAIMETPEPTSLSLVFGGGLLMFMLKKFRRKD